MSEGGDKHRARIATSYADWLKHRTILEAFRARPGDRRITPQPAYDVREAFPELAGLSTVTVRLHPRYGNEPPVDASKLGGIFLWPAGEPWPVCRSHEIPLVAVLQLRASDFPEMPFPPGTDLFQLLWCPREHHDVPGFLDESSPMYWAAPQFFWRNCRGIAFPRQGNPRPQEAYYEYIPFTCRLLPERVVEFPSVYDLPEDLTNRIYEWQDRHLDENGTHACRYEAELSAARGTKIGGYLHWIQDPWIPRCSCGTPMEHLLTIATVEWDGVNDLRWTPLEEQELFASFARRWDEWDEASKTIWHALWNPTGLSLGDCGDMKLFICCHCGRWPTVPVIECS
jgi:hypothetical protein